jgi:hypothetical protein
MYNFNEKNFLISLSRSIKRVVFIKSLKRKRTIGASQDKNREFITLIATIYVDRLRIPPALIY